MTLATSMASGIIAELKQKQDEKDIWKNSAFAGADSLKLDYSGKIGERFLANICSSEGIPFVYDEDLIDGSGHYDIEILGSKVEIKTARQSANGAFQHEGLRQAGSDYYAFVDLVPEDSTICLTILPTKATNLKEKHPILKRTPHLRKGTSDVYKFDFGAKTHKLAQKAGLAIKITKDTSVQEVGSFLREKITRL
jgi:hypothetical protein